MRRRRPDVPEPPKALIPKIKFFFKQWSGSYKEMLALAYEERATLITATIFLVLGSVIGLAAPKMIGTIVDEATSDGLEGINQTALILVGLFSAQGVAVALRYYLYTIAGQRIVCKLRRRAYSQIMQQEVAFFDKRKTGELLSRLASDAQVLQNTVTVNISMILRNAAMAIGGSALLIYSSPKLAGMMVLVIPPVVIVSLMAARIIRVMSRKVQDAIARSGDIAAETIAGLRTVRAFARESRETDRYSHAVDEAFDAMRKRTRAIAYLQGGLTIIGYGAIAMVLWMGGRMVIEGTMSIGDLTAFILYTGLVAFSLSTLGSLFTDFVSSAGAAERLFDILNREPCIPITGGKTPKKLEGNIHFENVSFAYPSRPDLPALSDVSFNIRKGEVIALVGHSGSGKSTIASLLSRFYDPNQGQILFDGHSLTEVDPSWLRKQIGIVSQEPILFSTNISENIGYGGDTYDQEAVKNAAKVANAHDFVTEFPEGYDTQVGERGVRLSGGQKQRIAIARAVLKDPQILILDEATSALDATSEHLVKDALDRLMQGRTALVIAHRLSTVKDADRVLVLDKGRLVEEGTHTELMKSSNGTYRKLVERQFAELPETDFSSKENP